MDQEEIKRAVIEQLHWDDRVDASGIDVEVDSSRVRLSGTVPNFAVKEAASWNAMHTPGVIYVENDLVVKEPRTGVPHSDEEIRQRIQYILDWDQEIDATDLEITVHNAHVYLKGSVPNYWQRLKAEDRAAGIRGVYQITNEITVTPTRHVDDKALAETIMAAFHRNYLLRTNTINLHVENGLVKLTGTVSNRSAYEMAGSIVSRTSYVKHFVNLLSIQPEIHQSVA